ncbi:metabotropic glutamate receptor 3-like [Branchiostoma floridae]|uniref:Metabotropic glutamate receptor 3-like n=1 Tax=Branchiostoma floridae TaxID=7739 RepID=A0A9J7N4F1_BRAFL|nr:metabotropic glutamate receptor 3-like [Branchiostoma floridae]
MERRPRRCLVFPVVLITVLLTFCRRGQAEQCPGRIAVLNGDAQVILAGLFDMHRADPEGRAGPCSELSPEGVESLEAMLFAVENVNAGGLVPGVTFGVQGYDTCGRADIAVKRCVDFLSSVGMDNIDPDDCESKERIVLGVVGPNLDREAAEVARVLRAVRLPQISPSGSRLSAFERDGHSFFLQSAPSAGSAAQGVLELVKKLGWTYVSLVSSDDSFGNQGSRAFRTAAEEVGVCIAVSQRVQNDSTENLRRTFDEKVIDRLLNKAEDGARGVVVFATENVLDALFYAAARKGARRLQWIVTGTPPEKIRAAELFSAARGLIVVSPSPDIAQIDVFKHSFVNLDPYSRQENPWFQEYFMETNQCALDMFSDELRFTKFSGYDLCDRNSKRVMENTLKSRDTATLDHISFTIDAVYAYAFALKKAHEKRCGGTPGICEELLEFSQRKMFQFLKAVNFTNLGGKKIQFDGLGSAIGKFSIFNYRPTDMSNIRASTFQFDVVGTYMDDRLDLSGDVSDLFMNTDDGQPVISACEESCQGCQVQSKNAKNDTTTDGYAKPEKAKMVIPALIPIHERGPTPFTCGTIDEGGVTQAEAFLYALNKINKDGAILPSVKLEAVIIDTCQSPLKAARDVANYHSSRDGMSDPMVGYVSGGSPDIVGDVGNVLDQFQIPLISTGPVDNMGKYNVLSMSPAEDTQIKGLVSVLDKLGWAYVSVVASDQHYWRKKAKVFEEMANKFGICIAEFLILSRGSSLAQFDYAVKVLAKRAGARAVIVFTDRDHTWEVVRAAKRLNLAGDFVWVGGRSIEDLASRWTESGIRNAIVVTPQKVQTPGFQSHYENLNPKNNRKNPWFKEFWESRFQCFVDDAIYCFFFCLQVGEWHHTLKLQPEDLKFYRGNGIQLAQPIKSFCDQVCQECLTQNLTGRLTGEPPEANPFENVKTMWGVSAMIISALGTVLVLAIYFKAQLQKPFHNNIAWSLGHILLLGIFMLYLTSFVYVLAPTATICGIRRFALGVSYVVCLSALLSHAIYAWIRGVRKEESPCELGIEKKMLLLLVALLVLVQVLLNMEWLLADPPSATILTEGESATWVCNALTHDHHLISFIVSLLYAMVLVLLTTLATTKAWLVNRSRDTLCACVAAISAIPSWLLWLAIYTKADIHTRDIVICYSASFNATLYLMVIFLPKLKVIQSHCCKSQKENGAVDIRRYRETLWISANGHVNGFAPKGTRQARDTDNSDYDCPDPEDGKL